MARKRKTADELLADALAKIEASDPAIAAAGARLDRIGEALASAHAAAPTVCDECRTGNAGRPFPACAKCWPRRHLFAPPPTVTRLLADAERDRDAMREALMAVAKSVGVDLPDIDGESVRDGWARWGAATIARIAEMAPPAPPPTERRPVEGWVAGRRDGVWYHDNDIGNEGRMALTIRPPEMSVTVGLVAKLSIVGMDETAAKLAAEDAADALLVEARRRLGRV